MGLDITALYDGTGQSILESTEDGVAHGYWRGLNWCVRPYDDPFVVKEWVEGLWPDTATIDWRATFDKAAAQMLEIPAKHLNRMLPGYLAVLATATEAILLEKRGTGRVLLEWWQ